MNKRNRAVIEAARLVADTAAPNVLSIPAVSELVAAVKALDALTPAHLTSLIGKRVVVLIHGQQVPAMVTRAGLQPDLIDVTTEEEWARTGRRKFLTGLSTATITLELDLS